MESQLLSHSLSHLTFVKIIVYNKSLIIIFMSDFFTIPHAKIGDIQKNEYLNKRIHYIEKMKIELASYFQQL